MQVKFDTDEKPTVAPARHSKQNFVSRLVLKTGLIENAKVADSISVFIAVILFVWFMISIISMLTPEEIDRSFYYDPNNVTPDAR